MNVEKLSSGYELRVMSKDDFHPLFQTHGRRVFSDETQVFHLIEALSPIEIKKTELLNEKLGTPYILRIGVFKDDEFVGWHMGRQETATSFYMVNSAILPAHQRKGLYGELLKRVVALATQEGFQAITSRHRCTNNAVIIPKLKFGFVITGIEVLDLSGTLVQLSYFPHPTRRKMVDYRVGHIKPDPQIAQLLGLHTTNKSEEFDN